MRLFSTLSGVNVEELDLGNSLRELAAKLLDLDRLLDLERLSAVLELFERARIALVPGAITEGLPPVGDELLLGRVP